ncbi:MAG: ABC transporter permease [Chryseolinea sp.]
MFKNNFKIALRSLSKQKIYTLINVLGLAVGIASCLVIVLFVRHEFSYDKFFENGDRIYRMSLERKYPNHSTFYAVVPHSFANVAERDFAEIEESAMVFGAQEAPFSYQDEKNEVKKFNEEYTVFVDSSFFNIFSIKFIKGDPSRKFGSTNDIVLTKEMAKRYFGETDPIGKTVSIWDQPYKVSGICEDLPANSHFKFSSLISSYNPQRNNRENFTTFSAYIYFKLKPGSDAAALEAKFPKMVDTYAAAEIERDLGKSWADYKKEGNGYRYFLQPLTSIHLDPIHLEAQMKSHGNITSVYIMISVAILILVIACINFMNLSTARSSERAKEVGVRKVMGSFRQQLIAQFLTESFILSALGVMIGVALVAYTLPFFNNLTQDPLSLPMDVTFIGTMVLVSICVGLLAGIYPSFVLSSFNPVVVMKGAFTSSQKGKWIRNGLVVFQFWISIILMIGTLVIQQQMKFMEEKSLGFDKEQVLAIENAFNVGNRANTLIEEIRQMPEVVTSAGTWALPGSEGDFAGIQFRPEGSSEILTTKTMVVADGLGETLGLELKEGRWYSDQTNDSLSIMVNESTVKVMGLENPIGRKLIQLQEREEGNVTVTFTITGIIKDFNFNSLRDNVTPLVIQSNESYGGGTGYIAVRIKPGETASAITALEQKWKKIAPEQPFKFSFLDERINQQYKAEQQTGKLFGVFSGLAIFVACIGLFALSAYITSLRTKEIGVRKVLGASVSNVVVLLAKDITRIVLIAFVLAVPVAWYIMEKWWLQNFAYRIEVNVWTIAISGTAAILTAWVTVSYQSIKAAIANPVKSLKSE